MHIQVSKQDSMKTYTKSLRPTFPKSADTLYKLSFLFWDSTCYIDLQVNKNQIVLEVSEIKIFLTLLFINALRHWISLCWFFLSILSCLEREEENNISTNNLHKLPHPSLQKIQVLTVSCPEAFPIHPREVQDLHVQNC